MATEPSAPPPIADIVTADYRSLFGDDNADRCLPDALQSSLGPLAYVDFLFGLARRIEINAEGEPRSPLARRRPDLAAMMLDEPALKKRIPRLSLVTEILDALVGRTFRERDSRLADYRRSRSDALGRLTNQLQAEALLSEDPDFDFTLPTDDELTAALEEGGVPPPAMWTTSTTDILGEATWPARLPFDRPWDLAMQAHWYKDLLRWDTLRQIDRDFPGFAHGDVASAGMRGALVLCTHLSPMQVRNLEAEPTTTLDDTLRTRLGLTGIDSLETLANTRRLLDRTGLNRKQLRQLLAVNGVAKAGDTDSVTSVRGSVAGLPDGTADSTRFGASFLNDGNASALRLVRHTDDKGATTTRIEGLAAGHLDRLWRLLRLREGMALSFAGLDRLLQAACAAQGRTTGMRIDRHVLRALGLFRHLHDSRYVAIDAFAAVIHEISPYATGRETPYYDQLFPADGAITPPVMDGEVFAAGLRGVMASKDTTGYNTLKDDPTLAALCAGLQVTLPTLLRHLDWMLDSRAEAAPTRTLSLFSACHRLAILPRWLGLKEDEGLALLGLLRDQQRPLFDRLAGKPTLATEATSTAVDTVDAIVTLMNLAEWLQQHDLQASRLQAVLAPGTASDDVVDAASQLIERTRADGPTGLLSDADLTKAFEHLPMADDADRDVRRPLSILARPVSSQGILADELLDAKDDAVLRNEVSIAIHGSPIALTRDEQRVWASLDPLAPFPDDDALDDLATRTRIDDTITQVGDALIRARDLQRQRVADLLAVLCPHIVQPSLRESLRRWAGIGYEDVLELYAGPADRAAIRRIASALRRGDELIALTGMTSDDVDTMLGHPAMFGLGRDDDSSALRDIDLGFVHRLTDWNLVVSEAARRASVSTTAIAKTLLAWINASSAQALAPATVGLDDATWRIGGTPPASIPDLAWTLRVLALTERSGLKPDGLIAFAALDTDSDATTVRTAAQQLLASFPEGDRQAIQRRHAAAWRDALVDWLLVHARDAEDRPFAHPDELSQWLLTDVSVGSEPETTRVDAAIDSLQLYIHRLLTGPEHRLSRPELLPTWRTAWNRWQRRYDDWREHEERQLYPENHIDPTRRQRKSAGFGDLEVQLAQGQARPTDIETNLLSYLTSFERLSNIQVISAYHDGIDPTKDKLLMIGRSNSEPAEYYLRTVDMADATRYGTTSMLAWSDWERIELPIVGELARTKLPKRPEEADLDAAKKRTETATTALNTAIGATKAAREKVDDATTKAAPFGADDALKKAVATAEREVEKCVQTENTAQAVLRRASSDADALRARHNDPRTELELIRPLTISGRPYVVWVERDTTPIVFDGETSPSAFFPLRVCFAYRQSDGSWSPSNTLLALDGRLPNGTRPRPAPGMHTYGENKTVKKHDTLTIHRGMCMERQTLVTRDYRPTLVAMENRKGRRRESDPYVVALLFDSESKVDATVQVDTGNKTEGKTKTTISPASKDDVTNLTTLSTQPSEQLKIDVTVYFLAVRDLLLVDERRLDADDSRTLETRLVTNWQRFYGDARVVQHPYIGTRYQLGTSSTTTPSLVEAKVAKLKQTLGMTQENSASLGVQLSDDQRSIHLSGNIDTIWWRKEQNTPGEVLVEHLDDVDQIFIEESYLVEVNFAWRKFLSLINFFFPNTFKDSEIKLNLKINGTIRNTGGRLTNNFTMRVSGLSIPSHQIGTAADKKNSMAKAEKLVRPMVNNILAELNSGDTIGSHIDLSKIKYSEDCQYFDADFYVDNIVEKLKVSRSSKVFSWELDPEHVQSGITLTRITYQTTFLAKPIGKSSKRSAKIPFDLALSMKPHQNALDKTGQDALSTLLKGHHLEGLAASARGIQEAKTLLAWLPLLSRQSWRVPASTVLLIADATPSTADKALGSDVPFLHAIHSVDDESGRQRLSEKFIENLGASLVTSERDTISFAQREALVRYAIDHGDEYDLTLQQLGRWARETAGLTTIQLANVSVDGQPFRRKKVSATYPLDPDIKDYTFVLTASASDDPLDPKLKDYTPWLTLERTFSLADLTDEGTRTLDDRVPTSYLWHTTEGAQYLDLDESGKPPIRLNTLFGKQLVGRATQSTRKVLSFDTQTLPEPALKRGHSGGFVDFRGANGLYFWELFFHAPWYIAWNLRERRSYDDAAQWCIRHLFNPFRGRASETGSPLPFWNALPLVYPMHVALPDDDAPERAGYDRNIVFRKSVHAFLVDTWRQQADEQFRKLTPESLREAWLGYQRALSLIGPLEEPGDAQPWRPVRLGDRDARFISPVNQRLRDTRDLIEERLDRLRHGRSIDGTVLPFIGHRADDALAFGGGRRQAGEARHLLRINQIVHHGFTDVVAVAQSTVDRLIDLGRYLFRIYEHEADNAFQVDQQKTLVALSDFDVSLKRQAIETLNQERFAMQRSRDAIVTRQHHYEELLKDGWLGIENDAYRLSYSAAGGYVLATIPLMVSGAVRTFPKIFGMAVGNADPGAVWEASASTLGYVSESLRLSSENLREQAMINRREQEWRLEAKIAQHDLDIIDAQKSEWMSRHKSALKELDQAVMHRQRLRTEYNTLTTGFAIADTYTWLLGRLGELFASAYQSVLALCLDAEASYMFETGDFEARHVHLDAWDGARHGMLAGEALQNDLIALRSAYVRQHRRRPLIRKDISVKSLIKEAGLVEGLKKNRLWISLSQRSFDKDYPGHYLRQIRHVTVEFKLKSNADSTPPPLRAILTQRSNTLHHRPDLEGVQWLYKPDGAPPGSVLRNLRNNQFVILSELRPLEQASVMETIMLKNEYQKDGRYAHFEGTGAVSDWTLTLPGDAAEREAFANAIDDIVLHLTYSAEWGGGGFTFNVKNLMSGEAAASPTREVTRHNPPRVLPPAVSYVDVRTFIGQLATAWTAFRVALARTPATAAQGPAGIALGALYEGIDITSAAGWSLRISSMLQAADCKITDRGSDTFAVDYEQPRDTGGYVESLTLVKKGGDYKVTQHIVGGKGGGSANNGTTAPGNTGGGSTNNGTTTPGNTGGGSTNDGTTTPGSTGGGSTDNGTTTPGNTGGGSTSNGSTSLDNPGGNATGGSPTQPGGNDSGPGAPTGGTGSTGETTSTTLPAITLLPVPDPTVAAMGNFDMTRLRVIQIYEAWAELYNRFDGDAEAARSTAIKEMRIYYIYGGVDDVRATMPYRFEKFFRPRVRITKYSVTGNGYGVFYFTIEGFYRPKGASSEIAFKDRLSSCSPKNTAQVYSHYVPDN